MFIIDRSDHSSQLFQDMARFIEDYLKDPSLGLAMVADRFSMTPQYVSTFFKKHSGNNLTEFIAKKRIDQAKLLMQNKDLTIVQIAQITGYMSDVVFIRAFKKIEGITPGKYRVSMLSMESKTDNKMKGNS
ncbi:HTH-type transcriptional activator Btr [compost metagenome]